MRKLTLLLMALLCCARPALADDSAYDRQYMNTPFYAEIIEAAKTRAGAGMVNFIENKVRGDVANRINPAAIWLRDNSVEVEDAAKINSLYFLSYSNVLATLSLAFKTIDMKAYSDMRISAIQNLFTYEALASADALRCDDDSVFKAMQNKTLVERVKEPFLQQAYQEYPQSSFVQFAMVAIGMEEKFAARPPNPDICRMGASKTTAPKYIPDDVWNKMRIDLRDSLMKVWEQRYAAILKQESPEAASPSTW